MLTSECGFKSSSKVECYFSFTIMLELLLVILEVSKEATCFYSTRNIGDEVLSAINNVGRSLLLSVV
jgi:hypothetical protein